MSGFTSDTGLALPPGFFDTRLRMHPVYSLVAVTPLPSTPAAKQNNIVVRNSGDNGRNIKIQTKLLIFSE